MTHAIVNQGIDWTAIKSGLLTGLEIASNKASQLKDAAGVLGGRLVTVIKSGMEQAAPYLQNKYIAAGSLFAVSYAFLAVGDLVSRLAMKVLPCATEKQVAIASTLAAGMSLSTWLGGVGAFCYYNALPLHPAAMVATVIASAIFAANCCE